VVEFEEAVEDLVHVLGEGPLPIGLLKLQLQVLEEVVLLRRASELLILRRLWIENVRTPPVDRLDTLPKELKEELL
jgi:hypothetical protein